LIGSHHGEHQFGSPVLPRTPEAFALHYIDNLDAKLEMVRDAYQQSQEIAPGIHERVFPLPTNLVRPLGRFTEREDLQEMEREGENS
jgi:3'-5' exoribonuclease